MTLGAKIRYLREIEGNLRGLGRAMTQQELVRAIQQQVVAAKSEGMRRSISQPYLSQIESGTRRHLTNSSRLLLAKFFKVHPGYLVDDPEGFHAELQSEIHTSEDKLDVWLVAGAERFRRDPQLRSALLTLSQHADSRGCLLLLESVLKTSDLLEGLLDAVSRRNASAASTGGSTMKHPVSRKGRGVVPKEESK